MDNLRHFIGKPFKKIINHRKKNNLCLLQHNYEWHILIFLQQFENLNIQIRKT